MKPIDWLSERMVFGLLIIVGFFSMGALSVTLTLSGEARQTAKDVLLVVGPLLGVIVQAIWKTDKTETQIANTAAVLASKAPDQSGTGPGTPPTPTPSNPLPIADPHFMDAPIK